MQSKMNKYEEETVNQLVRDMNLDQKTKDKAIDLFLEFKESRPELVSVQPQSSEQVPVCLCCAILISSKMQVYQSISGQVVQGTKVSVTQFLRGTYCFKQSLQLSIDLFHFKLKEFKETIDLSACSQIEDQINSLIRNFAFSITIFSKFNDVWSKLSVRDKQEILLRTLKTDLAEKLKRMAWLLFSCAKILLLQSNNDVVECAYLMISTLYLILTNIPRHLIESDLVKNDLEPEQIFNELKDIFSISDKDAVKISIQHLIKLTQKMKEKSYFRGVINGQEIIGLKTEINIEGRENEQLSFLDQENINHNIQKLDQYYQTRLTQDQLDERYFLDNDVKIQTPMKMTPFARQTMANKRATPEQKHGEKHSRMIKNAQRLLNYEQVPINNMTIKTRLNEIQFPNMVPQSPYAVKSFPQQTPITIAMEMDQWLNESIKKVREFSKEKLIGIQLPMKPLFEGGCLVTPQLNKYFSCCSQESVQIIVTQLESLMNILRAQLERSNQEPYLSQRLNQVRALYLKALEDMLTQEENKSKFSSDVIKEVIGATIFHKSILVSAVETVLLVRNEISCSFSEVLDMFELSAFDYWKIVNAYLKFDPVMPSPLKKHFRDIEIKIVSQMGWTNDSSIHNLLKVIFHEDIHMSNTSREVTPTSKDELNIQEGKILIGGVFEQTHEMFFKRSLQQSAKLIKELCDLLELNEGFQEQIWSVMKDCLSKETDILIDRHLDQLVLCCVYAICKLNQLQNTQFNSIITKYTEVKGDNKSSENYLKVKLQDDAQGDIIKFYNQVFISRMKPYVVQKMPQKQRMIQTSKPYIQVLAPQSPLGSNLPPPNLMYTTIYSKGSRTPNVGKLLDTHFTRGNMPLTPNRAGLTYQFGVSPSYLLTAHNEKIKNIRNTIQFPGGGAKQGGSVKDQLKQKVMSKFGGQQKALFSNLMTIDEKKEGDEKPGTPKFEDV